MVFRRKRFATKKKAAKYRRSKAKVSYPDRHNFKLEAGANVIYNSAPNVVTPAGLSLSIGEVVKQRTNFYQFGGALYFSLDKCLATTAFLAANFDRYKINMIKIRVIPENNFSAVSGAGTLPTMKVVYDYDDANIPTVGDVEVRRGKTYLLDKPFSIMLKPKVNQLIYNTAGVSAVSPQPAPWINMASLLVPHFGVKFMIRDWHSNSSGNDLQLRFQIIYLVSVKEQLALKRGPSLIEEDAAPIEVIEDLALDESLACDLSGSGMYIPVPK